MATLPQKINPLQLDMTVARTLVLGEKPTITQKISTIERWSIG